MENENEKTDKPTESTEEKAESNSLIDNASEKADRLDKENTRFEENIKRLEQIESRKILGGQSTSGSTQEQEKELTPAEYAQKILRGEVPKSNE